MLTASRDGKLLPPTMYNLQNFQLLVLEELKIFMKGPLKV